MDDRGSATVSLNSGDEHFDETELLDNDLENVVGGLERAWSEYSGMLTPDHQQHRDDSPTALPS